MFFNNLNLSGLADRIWAIASTKPASDRFTKGLTSIPIPALEESIRPEMVKRVGESHNALGQPNQRLKIAKTGLEWAMETDEVTATT